VADIPLETKKRPCDKCKGIDPDSKEKAEIERNTYYDGWFVEHCNQCDYWTTGRIPNNELRKIIKRLNKNQIV